MAKYIGQKIIQFEIIDSTQNYAKKIFSEVASGTVVMADCQTQGRGRLNRSWSSAPGLGIWMSIILKPRLEMADFPKITLVAAVALQEALLAFGVNAKIKWPNDILIEGKKVSGILTEAIGGDTVIVGCGINVNHSLEDLSEELREKASSLKIQLDTLVDREELYTKFFETFEIYMDLFKSEGFEAIRKIWMDNTDSIGKKVEVVMPNKTISGKVFGIDVDGVLLVEVGGNEIHRVISGDVFYDKVN